MDELLFDKKDVFNILNAEDASAYINKEGYFSNSLRGDRWEKGYLDEIILGVTVTVDHVFLAKDIDSRDYIIDYFGLFIPAEKVKEE